MNPNSTFIIKHSTFNIEVPFKLIQAEGGGEQPLIIYLHGYKQNLQRFERKVSSMLDLHAHHLLLQGPYPIYDERRRRKVENWGRAWYLYDGRQEQFKKSLEKSSTFIDEVIKNISDDISYSGVTVFGYSMGGYLAGYYALSRPEIVDNLIVIGGRIKTEWFTGNRYDGLNVLALHGSLDKSVGVSPAEKSSFELEAKGASVTFKAMEEGHRLSEAYITEVEEWLMAEC